MEVTLGTGRRIGGYFRARNDFLRVESFELDPDAGRVVNST